MHGREEIFVKELYRFLTLKELRKYVSTYSTITNPRLGQAEICRFALKFRWIVAMKERWRPLRNGSICIWIIWSCGNWWVGIIDNSPRKSVLSTVVFIGSIQTVFLTIAFPNFGDTNPIVTSKPIVRSTNLWFYQSNLCSDNEKNPKKRQIISSRIHGGNLWWRRSKSVWWERSEKDKRHVGWEKN